MFCGLGRAKSNLFHTFERTMPPAVLYSRYVLLRSCRSFFAASDEKSSGFGLKNQQGRQYTRASFFFLCRPGRTVFQLVRVYTVRLDGPTTRLLLRDRIIF